MRRNPDQRRSFAASPSLRQKSPFRQRGAGAKRKARPGQAQAWRIARNTALTILCWFALLGVCLLAYHYYFRFSN